MLFKDDVSDVSDVCVQWIETVVGGAWDTIALYNEGLHDLYSLPNIIRVIKLMSVRWAGHVARIGENYEYMQAVFSGEFAWTEAAW
jgi:hypothetical protein